jgi:hypothetical protein
MGPRHNGEGQPIWWPKPVLTVPRSGRHRFVEARAVVEMLAPPPGYAYHCW